LFCPILRFEQDAKKGGRESGVSSFVYKVPSKRQRGRKDKRKPRKGALESQRLTGIYMRRRTGHVFHIGIFGRCFGNNGGSSQLHVRTVNGGMGTHEHHEWRRAGIARRVRVSRGLEWLTTGMRQNGVTGRERTKESHNVSEREGTQNMNDRYVLGSRTVAVGSVGGRRMLSLRAPDEAVGTRSELGRVEDEASNLNIPLPRSPLHAEHTLSGGEIDSPLNGPGEGRRGNTRDLGMR
jgi:hypothetical protein